MYLYLYFHMFLLFVLSTKAHGLSDKFELDPEFCEKDRDRFHENWDKHEEWDKREERDKHEERDKQEERDKHEGRDEHEERIKDKDAWRPVFELEDRSKPVQHKNKDNKFFFPDDKPYYHPGIYTYPHYLWNYYRPPLVYPGVNYFIKKDKKDSPNFRTV